MKARFLALAALLFGLAACQTEPEGFDVNLGGEQTATISVVLPDDAITRAGGTDSAASGLDNTDKIVRVVMHIYDEAGRVSGRRYVDYLEGDARTVNFDIRLVPDRQYTFVAWADQVDTKEDVDKYFNTKSEAGLAYVTPISGTWTAMNEERDAFTATHTEANYTSSSNITLKLIRPFAKLRVVATDMEFLKDLDVKPTKAKVSYATKHYNAFNAVTGVAINKENTGVEHEYTIASYGENWRNGADMTLFTDYFFAADEQEVVNFSLEVLDQNNKLIKYNNFNTAIPVKRNNLTTIKGNVLTEGNDINVTIDERFENNSEWDPSDDKYDVEVFSGVYNTSIVLSKSGTYIFEDLKVNAAEAAVVVNEGVEAVIAIKGYAKLNGKQGIVVGDGAKLTIEGISETRSAERGGSLEVVATGGSAIGGKFITINNLAALTAKAGNVNCAYGIGAIDAEVTINNTKIDYVSGAFVQPLFVNDSKYGKSEPEGASAIGGKKVVLNGVELVKAEGGSKAAAIGNRYWQDTEVVIKNSTLGNVFGGNASAAIGGSRYASDGKHNVKILIENSTITNAVGGQFGAGIGSGYDTHCNQQEYTATNEIVITTSNINAKGGKYAAGIGTGFHSAYLTGSIDAESTITSVAGDEVWYKGEYTTAQNLGYGVVDPAREFYGNNATVAFTVAGVVIPSPIVNATYVTVNTRDEFQAAIGGAKKGENLIFFGANIEGDVTIEQAEGKNITIDGKEFKYDGIITVDGKNRNDGAETLRIMNINFESETASPFINCPATINGENERYSHNVTVEGCTFTSSAYTENVSGINAQKTYHLTVKNCEASNIHSLLQVQSCDNDVTVENVKVINCKNGISVGNTANTTIKGAEIKTNGYGVRADGAEKRKVNLSIENGSIEAYIPVCVRRMNADACNIALKFKGTTTLTKGGFYEVAICSNEYEEGKTAQAPKGSWTVTGADNYAVYPRQNVVTTQADLEAAANAGYEVITIAAGTYELSTVAFAANNVKLEGLDKENVVLNLSKSIYLENKSVTLENLTFNTPADLAYDESTFGFIHHAKNFNLVDCNATRIRLNVYNSEIKNCAFNVDTKSGFDGYAVFYYGKSGSKAVVNKSTFNTVSKGIVMYNEGAVVYDLEVNECTFVASKKDDKAAIQMHTECGISGKLAINRSTATGFADVNGGLWNEVNNNTGVETNKFNIFVDGELVHIAYDGEVVASGLTKKSASEYNVYNANGLVALNTMMQNKTAGKNVIVNIMADIDFAGKTWTPVDSHADSAFTFSTLNGNYHTISNLTINGQAMFTRFAGTGDVTIKNVTFDYADVNSNGALNTSILTVQAYQNVLLDNVDVKNSAITGGYKVAPLMGTVYNEAQSTVTATLKNCDVENTIVKATLLDFCTTGMVAFVYEGNNDRIEFENCTIKDVKLYARPGGYAAHAAIYVNDAETDDCFNEAEGVTVTNVTFEAI